MSFPETAAVYTSKHGLTIKRLEPALGAEICGLDLSGPIAPEMAEDLRQALRDHGVIGIRDQEIDYKQHVALGNVWGKCIPEGPDPERPEIRPVKSTGMAKNESADKWHSDSLHLPCPPMITSLRCLIAPSLGGDTAFSSAVAAYAGLSDEMKAKIADLTFHTSLAHVHARQYRKSGGKALYSSVEKWRELEEKYPATDHPVVRVHPETHVPVLFINEVYPMYINGMEMDEGARLWRQLCDEFKRPEYQARWKWTPGAIAIWDNRQVQHYGVPNQMTDRSLERITIEGDKPISLAEWHEAQQTAAAA
jgi:alpha-ketoglutarate-dependent taurine dioxygenase